MARVLIAEKQTLIREMLRNLLETDSYFGLVCEAADSAGVMSKIKQLEVNLLILDTTIPGMSWLELIIQAKAACPELAILVLSKNPDTQLVSQAFKNGARGYISTMQNSEEFFKAMQKVAEGGRYIDSVIAESMTLDSISGNDKPIHSRLSQREYEIFRLLVAGKNINQISEQLNISNKTVSAHKKNMMQKMHFSNMVGLMRYAMQHKLFDEPSSHLAHAELLPVYTGGMTIQREDKLSDLREHTL